MPCPHDLEPAIDAWMQPALGASGSVAFVGDCFAPPRLVHEGRLGAWVVGGPDPSADNATTRFGLTAPVFVLSAHKTASSSLTAALRKIGFHVPNLAYDLYRQSDKVVDPAAWAAHDPELYRETRLSKPGGPPEQLNTPPVGTYVDDTFIPMGYMEWKIATEIRLHPGKPVCTEDSPTNHGDLYRYLHALYPDARFILTTRDADAWATSFTNYINKVRSTYSPSMLHWLQQLYGPLTSDVHIDASQRGAWEEPYRDRVAAIIHYFQTRGANNPTSWYTPRAYRNATARAAEVRRAAGRSMASDFSGGRGRLLVIGIEHLDWAPVLEFLGIPESNATREPFPHTNVT